MGFTIFESDGTFSPAACGLVAGDVVDVILVGGGSSGAIGSYPGVAGGSSTFGSESSANGTVMGKGGPAYSVQSTQSSIKYYSGTGAGGYLPGLPVYGGNGNINNDIPGTGLAGSRCASPSPHVNYQGYGNKGASGGSSAEYELGPGGNGYGAGGSGGYSDSTAPGAGGDAGKIRFCSVVLQSAADVAVTVGAGGENDRGTIQALKYSCGAPGVVLVFW